jgi:hypothetical protein
MGLGMSYESGNGGDGNILPFVKYDARAGRFFRNDRTQDSSGSYTSTPVDITNKFKAVFDFENVEVGYISFAAGSAPQHLLVPLGDPMPQKPADGKWKQGVRVMIKLGNDCGGSVREITSNATAFLRGIDDLHSAYEAGVKQNPGKLPIVTMKESLPITSGQGDKKSTNYQPVFEIVGWAPRPVDLVFVPKGRQTTSPSTQPAQQPPATGSTQVSAPAPKAAPQPAMADAEEFG